MVVDCSITTLRANDPIFFCSFALVWDVSVKRAPKKRGIWHTCLRSYALKCGLQRSRLYWPGPLFVSARFSSFVRGFGFTDIRPVGFSMLMLFGLSFRPIPGGISRRSGWINSTLGSRRNRQNQTYFVRMCLLRSRQPTTTITKLLCDVPAVPPLPPPRPQPSTRRRSVTCP